MATDRAILRNLARTFRRRLLPGTRLVAGLLLVSHPAVGQGDPVRLATTGPDVTAIRKLRAGSNQAIARHDTAGIGAIFAPGVVVVSSTSSTTMGRDENARRFAEIFVERPDVVFRRTPKTIRVDTRWRMASEHGVWTGRWTAAGGRIDIGGSYFAKWREIGGRWLVESETYVPEHCTGGEYCLRPP